MSKFESEHVDTKELKDAIKVVCNALTNDQTYRQAFISYLQYEISQEWPMDLLRSEFIRERSRASAINFVISFAGTYGGDREIRKVLLRDDGEL